MTRIIMVILALLAILSNSVFKGIEISTQKSKGKKKALNIIRIAKMFPTECLSCKKFLWKFCHLPCRQQSNRIARHKLVRLWALFSGGKKSLKERKVFRTSQEI